MASSVLEDDCPRRTGRYLTLPQRKFVFVSQPCAYAHAFRPGAIMKVKLNQIIAVEKGTKERVHKEFTSIYQSFAKTEPMQGISRTYQPATEDGEQLPPEHKYVQVNVAE